MNSISLQCPCGNVELEIRGEPVRQIYCHCDDCQATVGGACIPIALYPAESVRIVRGETTTWVYKVVPRTRCRNCGTLLFAEPAGTRLRGVSGNLLPRGRFKPEFHIFCEYAALPVKDDLPHYRKLPAMFGGSDETVSW